MDIIRSGAVLLVLEAALVITFLVISTPVSTTISAIATAGLSVGVTQMTYYKNLVNQVMGICFILAALAPVIWFLLEVWRREPDWGYK